MNKKYQVFISSTFTDMKAERQAAVEAILDAGHIPAGMELFAASDRKQIEVIKSWIDRSDIFMLILGGRYGSVDPDSGKSYIQVEYEHAVETGKPHFALYLTDKAIRDKAAGPLSLDATEQIDTKALKAFRDLVKSKLCSEIEDVKDIRIQVPKSIRDLSESRNLEGWVRASSVPDLTPLLAQMKLLQEENERLKQSKSLASKAHSDAEPKAGSTNATKAGAHTGEVPVQLEESALQKTIKLSVKNNRGTFVGYQEVTYLAVLMQIGPKLLDEPLDRIVKANLDRIFAKQMAVDSRLADESFQEIKMKFIAWGVVQLRRTDAGTTEWALTKQAKELLLSKHAPD